MADQISGMNVIAIAAISFQGEGLGG